MRFFTMGRVSSSFFVATLEGGPAPSGGHAGSSSQKSCASNDIPPQVLGTFEGMLEHMPPQPVFHDGADLPVAARSPLESQRQRQWHQALQNHNMLPYSSRMAA